MKTAVFNRLGKELGGVNWKSWLAMQTGWSRSHINRIARGDYPVPMDLVVQMKALARQKRRALKT